MRTVTVYTRPYCSYCSVALRLLQQVGAEVVEIDVSNAARRQDMIARSGRYTVPQVFIDDVHIGGCDDLSGLDRSGVLARLLSDKAA